MAFRIRPFADSDYEGYARAYSAIWHDPITTETLRWQDGQRDPKHKQGRWVAEADGRIVGSAQYFQRVRTYHPQKFQIDVGVHPDYRGRGIGAALYEQLVGSLAEHDPITLTTRAREDWADSVGFLERRGFVENLRTWESHLDLAGLDLQRFQPWLDSALARGYRLANLTEFQATAGWDEQLFNLITEIRWDTPADEPRVAISLEAFKKSLSGRHLWPETYLVGLFDGKPVATSQLFGCDIPGTLNTGLTGALRDHRGTGIARALKVRALQVAKEAGYRTVRTWNESNNQRMLAINLQLGFQRLPAWVTYKRYDQTQQQKEERA